MKIKIADFYKIQENSMKKMKILEIKKQLATNCSQLKMKINVLSEKIGQFNINDFITIK
jgi:hypothetical protein